MRRNRLTVSLGLALALATVHAADQTEFAAMDANKDGRLTAKEHADAARRMFTTMDANRDGAVNVEEMESGHYKITGRPAAVNDLSAAEKIKAVDGDGDGVLSAAEHEAGSRRMFEAMDSDRDGVLSKSEFDAGHKK